MAGPVDTRKRSREEEQNEFMPLSKRINNLHLNNNQNSIGSVLSEQVVGACVPFVTSQIQQHECVPHQCHHLHGTATSCSINLHNNHHLITAMAACGSNSNSNSSSSNGSSNGSLGIPANSGSTSPASTISINGEILGEYCPVLSAEENPHYFTKNKVLYELYVERMNRLQ
ncbi:uncharacterized protein LOC128721465 [Anopheles nili]|uniref:uncharacterized protein LOC128721465 n=1 Tax=Anopheles nili TaxID=185578 RepID=UPI00237A2A31|nr:uncharacterized protein LOC128721465 [Anopheles nili]